jgi:hypothetical protein
VVVHQERARLAIALSGGKRSACFGIAIFRITAVWFDCCPGQAGADTTRSDHLRQACGVARRISP